MDEDLYCKVMFTRPALIVWAEDGSKKTHTIHLGWRIAIRTKDGKSYKGLLSEINTYNIEIAEDAEEGKYNFHRVPAADIEWIVI